MTPFGSAAQVRAVLLLAVLLAGCAADAPDETPAVETPPQEAPTTDAAVSSTAPAPNATAPPAVTLEVVSGGLYPVNPAYTVEPASLPSGATVTATYTNSDQNPLGKHDWKLDGVAGAATEVIEVGKSSTVTFTAPAPGEYVYFCSVPGHRERGLEGRLTVT